MYDNSIILLDLDHTLYNAFDPWRNLVSKIFIHDLGWKTFPWRTFNEIRTHYRVFDIFFEKSFRHYWLSQELIVLLLGIKNQSVSSEDLLDELAKFEIRLSLIRTKEYRPSIILSSALEFTKNCKELNKALKLIEETRDNLEIKEIEDRFWSDAKITCYDGVFDLLSKLSKENARFYLVSEGDYELQVWKTKLLGIQQFFVNKILVTESYKQSSEYLRNLELVKKIISNKDNEVFKESEKARQADSVLRKFELLKLKEDLFFYYAIFKSILQDPKNPEREFIFTDIDELLDISELTEGKVVMVGDRIDKDILPIWKIFGKNSELIRIRCGKYKTNDLQSNIPKSVYKEFPDFSSIYNHFLNM